MARRDAAAPEAGLLAGSPSAALMVVGTIGCAQVGSALGATLFARVGPGGAVLLRLVSASVVPRMPARRQSTQAASGITKTRSRPYASSDNPYLESNFKTLKYRPEFPARFDSIEQARGHCRAFFDGYNHAHRHSAIGLMTPAAVHHGHAEQLRSPGCGARRCLPAAPRTVRSQAARAAELPAAAWINEPKEVATAH